MWHIVAPASAVYTGGLVSGELNLLTCTYLLLTTQTDPVGELLLIEVMLLDVGDWCIWCALYPAFSASTGTTAF